jgi:hypothetical protein
LPAPKKARKSSDIVAWMRDSPLIAVQVVNYRTRRYLERCVETVVSDLVGSSMAFEINLLADLAADVHRATRVIWQR